MVLKPLPRDRRRMMSELRGQRCRCGSRKKNGHTFCFRCYRRLPPGNRQALYYPFGEGYEEAYAEAVELLSEK